MQPLAQYIDGEFPVEPRLLGLEVALVDTDRRRRCFACQRTTRVTRCSAWSMSSPVFRVAAATAVSINGELAQQRLDVDLNLRVLGCPATRSFECERRRPPVGAHDYGYCHFDIWTKAATVRERSRAGAEKRSVQFPRRTVYSGVSCGEVVS